MERFLSPGWRARPAEPPQPKRGGRPAQEVREGALHLGDKRHRSCASKQREEEKLELAAMKRRIEVLEARASEVPESEKMDSARLHML